MSWFSAGLFQTAANHRHQPLSPASESVLPLSVVCHWSLQHFYSNIQRTMTSAACATGSRRTALWSSLPALHYNFPFTFLKAPILLQYNQYFHRDQSCPFFVWGCWESFCNWKRWPALKEDCVKWFSQIKRNNSSQNYTLQECIPHNNTLCFCRSWGNGQIRPWMYTDIFIMKYTLLSKREICLGHSPEQLQNIIDRTNIKCICLYVQHTFIQ